MLKIVKSSIAVCLTLTSVAAFAAPNDKADLTCHSDTQPTLSVEKKQRDSEMNLAQFFAPSSVNCIDVNEQPELLLDTVEANTLLNKKLPGTLIASR